MAARKAGQQDSAAILRVLGEADTPYDATREQPLTSDPPPDRTRQFRSTNFSRMRTEWPEEAVNTIAEIRARADRELKKAFGEAFRLRDRILLSVRVAKTDSNGTPVTENDEPVWETDEDGAIAEDWALLTDEQRDRYIYTIATHSFEWELAGVALWHEAMLGKVQWEQAFARGYLEPQGRYTIDDRTQEGHYASDLERYHAIYMSALSRGGDAIIKSMDRILTTLERTRR